MIRFQDSLRTLGLCAILTILLTGCATQTRALLDSPQGLPDSVELINTPYFAQQAHQCGPASLAMALGAAGLDTSPETLEALVYVPSIRGSLQPEMLAAARRQGAFAVTVKPQLNALLAEVANGNPVVVLQNLGLSWLPQWHYAVVIGYDLPSNEIFLRSGPNQRERMTLSTFEHTWARSGYWGMLALRPGKLPRKVDLDDAVRALAALEKYAPAKEMMRAYQVALERWPDSLTLQMGLGNSAYRAGDLPASEAIFRSANETHPDNAAVLNNLAMVLQSEGQFMEALAIAEKAAAMNGPWQEQAVNTRNLIQESIRAAADASKKILRRAPND